MSENIAFRAATAARTRVTNWRDTAISRIDARADSGQTSVEYLGIIVVVVAIVIALAGTGLGQTIYQAIVSQIDKVVHMTG